MVRGQAAHRRGVLNASPGPGTEGEHTTKPGPLAGPAPARLIVEALPRAWGRLQGFSSASNGYKGTRRRTPARGTVPTPPRYGDIEIHGVANDDRTVTDPDDPVRGRLE